MAYGQIQENKREKQVFTEKEYIVTKQYILLILMECLDIKEIERLASKPGVRRIAVENFLLTVENNDNSYIAMENLYMDAGLYKWNIATQKAIKEGIKKYFSCKR